MTHDWRIAELPIGLYAVDVWENGQPQRCLATCLPLEEATLIAAAPDLVAALEGMESYITHAFSCPFNANHHDRCTCGLHDAEKQARAVLARARGVTP